MRNPHLLKKTVLLGSLFASTTPMAALGAQLTFSQLPAGRTAIPPAPNVIVTVDDSGSMDEKVGGGDNKTKMFRLKEALNDVFSDTVLLPDGRIRLAWQAMHNNGSSPGAGSLTVGAVNSMKVLDATHRANFLSFASNLRASGGTPSHQMMKQAYNYMTVGQSINSPWAHVPGSTEAPYMSCRRAYHIFMTDGAWNGYNNSELPGNQDNADRTLPDTTSYSTTSDQTYAYRGKSGNLSNLLADWAFKMWADDLQPGIPNDVRPSTTDGVPSTETHGAIALQRYWNPKHNPATWQHLVHYTIGYGVSAYSWPGEPKWSLSDDDNYGGDYSRLVQGLVSWSPTSFGNLNVGNPAELWHMALNSRGKFYPTGPGRKNDLKQAFRLILEDINLQNSADVTSMTGSASTAIRTGLNRYTARYEPKRWSGYVRSDQVSTAGVASPDPNWGITPSGKHVTTAEKLDARPHTDRVILTYNDDLAKGVPFEWETGTTKLSATQKASLDGGGLGERRLNFLRGDRTDEGGTPSKPFRERDSAQGDIVNSSVWYVERPSDTYSLPGYKAFVSTHSKRDPMVYVGGNDGMLHGFSARDGAERIAYVPRGLYPELARLSDPAYKHRYYVDGSPFSGDVDTSDKSSGSGPAWKTLLVGTLGAGGKGYFVLDITSPGTPTTPTSFTTGNAQSLVVMDRTLHPAEALASGSDDEDIGHMFAPPVLDDNNPFKTTQIVRLNNKRWAAVMGNGYNSKKERPVLLVQYLDGAMELHKIVATGNQEPSVPVDPVLDANVIGNGLSAPRTVDIDGNGTTDVVYAGDLKGNLWKFDLTNPVASLWSVAQFSGTSQPLFKAQFAGKRQPISAPPTVRANDRGAGGMMVAFGTGVNVTDSDRTSTDVQTVYSILDNTKYKLVSGSLTVDTTVTPTAVSGVSKLVEQEMDDLTGNAGAGASTGRRFWTMKNKNVVFKDPGNPANEKLGWYFHLQVSGERVLRPMSFFDRSNNLMIFSASPAYGGSGATGESCEPTGTPEKQFLTLMNIMDGKKPSVQVMDLNGDGLYVSGSGTGGPGNPPGDKDVSRMSVSSGAVGMTTGEKIVTLTGSDGQEDKLRRMPEQPLRPSWRQLR